MTKNNSPSRKKARSGKPTVNSGPPPVAPPSPATTDKPKVSKAVEAAKTISALYGAGKAIYEMAVFALKFLQDNNFIGFTLQRGLAEIIEDVAPTLGEGLTGVLAVSDRTYAIAVLCVEIGRLSPTDQAKLKAVQSDGSTRSTVEYCFVQAIVQHKFSLNSAMEHDELTRMLVDKMETSRRRMRI